MSGTLVFDVLKARADALAGASGHVIHNREEVLIVKDGDRLVATPAGLFPASTTLSVRVQRLLDTL